MSDGTDPFTNDADVIDSRDIIARIEFLEGCRDEQEAAEANEADVDPTDLGLGLDEAEIEELKALKELADECSGYAPDWTYGATLIHEDYFEDYAREMAEDIGAISSDASWPLMHIDWEAAANDLKIDYTEVDFDGQTYYIR